MLLNKKMMKIKIKYIWFITVLLMFATALSFLDRQVLSISIIKIKDDLNITDIEYGFINSGFLISYAVMFTLGGILIDRYGSRRGLGFSVAFWSLATSLHGLAQNATHFIILRFFLGIGEGGCFPGAIKAVIEWVPKNKRALANGIAIGGSAMGAVIALPMCAYFLGFASWRWVFFGSGLIGMTWFVIWWGATNKKISKPVLVDEVSEKTLSGKVSWKDIFNSMKAKEAWVFIVIRFLLDPIFYFYMFWIPKYLSDVKNLPIDKIGYITWIPFLALGIANVLGGWFSDIALAKTESINKARKLVMGIGAALTIPMVFVGNIESVTIVIFLMSLAFFAHGLWITNYITSIGDVFGKKSTSSIVGLSGTAGALSSFVINPLIGYVVDCSYSPLWIYSGIMYPVAFIILLLFLPKISLRPGYQN
jgi:ACS family hexuronate transporter-like MFS transporter